MLKAIIVDDEQLCLTHLENLLLKSGGMEIKAKFTKSLAALDFLQNNQIDVAFLDIEMPDMDGIELANRAIDIQERLAVIFVTAYNQYAVEAFRLNALDYLMKPVTAERLRETLDRIVSVPSMSTQICLAKIRCFGKFQVTAGNTEINFRHKKAEELLAFLIDRKGDFVDRWEICDHLWEEYDGDRALINFHSTLHRLKKTLFQQGAEIPIEHDDGNYRLDINGLDCDYLRFQRFTAASGSIDQSSISEYEAVTENYNGDYLAGKEYAWAKRNRLMMRERFIMLVLQIAEVYQTAGDLQKSIAWLKQGLYHEHLHRELNYRLIRTLLLANDHLQAGRYYEIYQHDLKRKLNQEPDQEFTELLG